MIVFIEQRRAEFTAIGDLGYDGLGPRLIIGRRMRCARRARFSGLGRAAVRHAAGEQPPLRLDSPRTAPSPLYAARTVRGGRLRGEYEGVRDAGR
jgi:hypothetical protein